MVMSQCPSGHSPISSLHHRKPRGHRTDGVSMPFRAFSNFVRDCRRGQRVPASDVSMPFRAFSNFVLTSGSQAACIAHGRVSMPFRAFVSFPRGNSRPSASRGWPVSMPSPAFVSFPRVRGPEHHNQSPHWVSMPSRAFVSFPLIVPVEVSTPPEGLNALSGIRLISTLYWLWSGWIRPSPSQCPLGHSSHFHLES